MFRFFENSYDPFFNFNQEQQRNQMDDCFGFGGFENFFIRPMLGLPDDKNPVNFGNEPDFMMRRHGNINIDDQLSFFQGMMSDMNSRMMLNAQRMREEAFRDKNALSYSHSTMRSYSDDGLGKPKMFEAITETKKGPGGVRQSKRAIRDSESGTEKMEIGRHIDDRGHVVMRERNMRSGDIYENQNFLNMAEEEKEAFDTDWQRRSAYFRNPLKQLMLSHPNNRKGHQQSILDMDPSLENDV